MPKVERVRGPGVPSSASSSACPGPGLLLQDHPFCSGSGAASVFVRGVGLVPSARPASVAAAIATASPRAPSALPVASLSIRTLLLVLVLLLSPTLVLNCIAGRRLCCFHGCGACTVSAAAKNRLGPALEPALASCPSLRAAAKIDVVVR